MEFTSQIQPFRINRLTELINEEVLELIQLGFVQQYKTPMTMIEKMDDNYIRIPKRDDSQPWTEYCKYLRSFPEGNQICVNCDRVKAEQMISSNSTSAEKYVCVAGLVDICIPIVIGGKTIAVSFGGQKRYKNFDNNIEDNINSIAKIVPHLDTNKLSKYAESVEQLTEDEFTTLTKKLLKIVHHITKLAKDSYNTKRRLQEEMFLDAVISYFMSQYGRERRPVQQVINEILKGFNQFADLSTSILFYENETTRAFSAPNAFSEKLIPEIKDLIDKCLIQTKTDPQNHNKDRSEFRTIIRNTSEHISFIQNLERILNKTSISIIYISRGNLFNTFQGYFLFIDCYQENSTDVVRQIPEEKVRFLEGFVSRMREQINAYLVDEEETELVAGLAHQLKSPMHSILGRCWKLKEMSMDAISQLSSDALGEADIKIAKSIIPVFIGISPVIRDIENYITILKYKTDCLLYLTSSEKGLADFDYRQWSIPSLLRDRIDNFKSQGERYGKSIRLLLGPKTDRKISVDRERMGLVFDNLLENAIKYSYANKEILVTVAYDESISSYIIRVDNFGLGIMPEEQDLIFKRYYRGKIVRDSKRQISGTGIGLAVVKSIIQAHGGTISVISKGNSPDGEGFRTIFTVEIPTRNIQK